MGGGEGPTGRGSSQGWVTPAHLREAWWVKRQHGAMQGPEGGGEGLPAGGSAAFGRCGTGARAALRKMPGPATRPAPCPARSPHCQAPAVPRGARVEPVAASGLTRPAAARQPRGRLRRPAPCACGSTPFPPGPGPGPGTPFARQPRTLLWRLDSAARRSAQPQRTEDEALAGRHLRTQAEPRWVRPNKVHLVQHPVPQWPTTCLRAHRGQQDACMRLPLLSIWLEAARLRLKPRGYTHPSLQWTFPP